LGGPFLLFPLIFFSFGGPQGSLTVLSNLHPFSPGVKGPQRVFTTPGGGFFGQTFSFLLGLPLHKGFPKGRNPQKNIPPFRGPPRFSLGANEASLGALFSLSGPTIWPFSNSLSYGGWKFWAPPGPHPLLGGLLLPTINGSLFGKKINSPLGTTNIPLSF